MSLAPGFHHQRMSLLAQDSFGPRPFRIAESSWRTRVRDGVGYSLAR